MPQKMPAVTNTFKRALIVISIQIAALFAPSHGNAQTYIKMNGLYALGGIINPAVELTVSDRFTFQNELILSPWRSIKYEGLSRPMNFGMVSSELRYHFNGNYNGWFGGVNAGLNVFKMSKPYFDNGLHFKNTYSKGYGIVFGISGGYQWTRDRWLFEARVGINRSFSWYNGYSLIDGLRDGAQGNIYDKGEIIMDPLRDDPDHWNKHPLDPFNGSAEWIPTAGFFVGYLINKPR